MKTKMLLMIWGTLLFAAMQLSAQERGFPYLAVVEQDSLSAYQKHRKSFELIAQIFQRKLEKTIWDTLSEDRYFRLAFLLDQGSGITKIEVMRPQSKHLEKELQAFISDLAEEKAERWIFPEKEENKEWRIVADLVLKKGQQQLGIFPIPPPPPPPPMHRNNNDIFVKLPKMPRFPGCEDMVGTQEERDACSQEKFMAFIYSELRYPMHAYTAGVEGSVQAQFIIDKRGRIEQVWIRQSPLSCMAEEVKRVLWLIDKKGLTWKPGSSRGRYYKVRMDVEVVFEKSSVPLYP
ncbi:MAG: energy transducer TonB [Saprospiraceae bacterium]|nr:energy transducer TonB [Saprospiraceae bacterium]